MTEAATLPHHAFDTQDALQQITSTFLSKPTAKQRILTKLMRSTDNRHQEYCDYLTRQECHAARLAAASTSTSTASPAVCQKLHFRPLYFPQTDASYGHCSYLNTCHRTATCKYLHFELDDSPPHAPFAWQTSPGHRYQQDSIEAKESSLIRPAQVLAERGLQCWIRGEEGRPSQKQLPAQWIDCDLKNFDYSILGKFDVIVADPPWDIHMSLPYGTMSDDDMRAMPFPQLQDEGLLFLWTTGRAMELGRELLGHWGYTRIDELIWIKIGQTQRLIRTGRTGHHLNHTKEHCLVGVKVSGDKATQYARANPLSGATQRYFASHAAGVAAPLPSWVHAGIGADVIVSEVRDTSRKPDELYGIIERLCPGGRKVELFGRKHNTRRGWLTLGNQLKGDCVVCNLVPGMALWQHDPVLRDRLAEYRQTTGARPVQV